MKKLFFITAMMSLFSMMFAAPKSFIEEGGGATEATEEVPVVEEAQAPTENTEEVTSEVTEETTAASTANVVSDGEAD